MADLSQKTFLIVDDFQNMRSTLTQMLKSLGVQEIDTATNGKEAVDFMSKRPYDIVLCDYNLGEGKDGQQVLEEVKQRHLQRHSSIFVIITAESAMDMVLGAVEYKPDDYLTKPFTKDVLRKRLERQLQRKEEIFDIERAIHDEEYTRAIELCDERIAAKPRNVSEFIRLKVGVCLSVGRYQEVETICSSLLSERDLSWASLALGQAHFHQGHYEAALGVFQPLATHHQTLMEAHDWLAKTLMQMGNTVQAEEVLTKATAISPRVLQRQRMLGDVAARNENLPVAERAYRKTVQLGRESISRSPSHYIALSKVLAQTASPLEALKTIDSLRKDFRSDDKALLQAALAEGKVFQQLGRDAEAKKALQEAAALHERGVQADAGTAMEMAQAYIQIDEKEKGLGILQNIVRNHHEDVDVIAEAKKAFSDLGLEEEAAQLITSTQALVSKLNNEGVGLVKDGKLDEANRLFEKAAQEMPENRTVNLNAAQALLMWMQKTGRNDEGLLKARQYLERVRRKNPSDATMHRLWAIYEKIAGPKH